jgi:hypothetical protein
MPEVSQHVPNTPGWIDIGTEVEAAKAFYTALRRPMSPRRSRGPAVRWSWRRWR